MPGVLGRAARARPQRDRRLARRRHAGAVQRACSSTTATATRACARRIELTERLIGPHAALTRVVATRGESALERVCSLVLLGDLVSCYLAALADVDPTRRAAAVRAEGAAGGGRMSRHLAIVPALNEAGSIAQIVAEIHEHAPGFDVLVLDDGSTDETAAIAAAGRRSRDLAAVQRRHRRRDAVRLHVRARPRLRGRGPGRRRRPARSARHPAPARERCAPSRRSRW